MEAVSGVLELLVIIAIFLVRASVKSGKKEASMRQTPRKLNEQRRELTEAMSQKQRELTEAMSQKQRERMQMLQRPAQQTQQSRPQQTSRKQAASQAYRATQKQESYRTAQEQTTGRQKDILARATGNVHENDVDELERQDLMGTVENLMIMGYQPKLSYQRDFLAEGIEMLNTYTVPDMVPEFTMDNSMPTVG